MLGTVILAAVCAPALLPGSGGAAPPAERKITIVYSAQAGGQIRSCNCTKFRYGGYGREATLLDQVRKEADALVIVEGGDFVSGSDTAQDKLKTSFAMDALGALKYSVMVPGEAEVRYAKTTSADLDSLSKVPVAEANVYEAGSDTSIVKKPYVICKAPKSGLRVAVIGILGPEVAPRDFSGRINLDVKDPVETVTKLAPEVRKEADFVLVVAHASPEESRAIAEKGGVDMVLCTHDPAKLKLVPKEGNTVDAPVEMVGNCLYVDGGSRFGWSVGRVDIEMSGDKIKSSTHRLLFLDRAYEEDPQLLKMYESYNKDVRQLALDESKKLREEMEKLYGARGFDPAKFKPRKTFLGADACKDCHSEIYDKWSKSAHAHAIATLEKTKQEYDPECVYCHTTGPGQKGGFQNLKDTPELSNVQCEACHGPGAKHVESPKKGFGGLQEELCRSCHTDELDPEFDYAIRWKTIEH